MTRKEYEAQLAAFAARLSDQSARGSKGTFGKLADELYRRAMLEKGVNADCRVGCRGWDEDDALTKRFGRVEIKTGSGAVCYGMNLTSSDRVPANICKDADTIVWIPFPKLISKETLFSAAWVFSRDEFIACLTAIGKKGLDSSLKISSHGTQINIQTISNKLEDRLWDVLEATPTVDKLQPAHKLEMLAEIFAAYLGLAG